MRSGYRRVVCHNVVSLVKYYFHGREVGLPTGGMPRCCELVIYYFHGREVRLPTGGMPQCREFGYILLSTVVMSGLPTGGLPRCREVGFTRQFTMDIWYGILLVFWVNCNYLNLFGYCVFMIICTI